MRFCSPTTSFPASDVGSIPIARSITHDDSIVLTAAKPTEYGHKIGGFWSHDGPNRIELVPVFGLRKLEADGRRHQLEAALASIILNPSFLNCDLENR